MSPQEYRDRLLRMLGAILAAQAVVASVGPDIMAICSEDTQRELKETERKLTQLASTIKGEI